MQPMSPVLPTFGEGPQVTFAKDQPEYKPLPTLCTARSVMSRWKLTDEERKHIAAGGDLFIIQLNFSAALQPILPLCCDDETAERAFFETAKPQEG